MRGLKHRADGSHNAALRVAPFTGAWIETLLLRRTCLALMVAPFTGAWIETDEVRWADEDNQVAPFTGA